MIFQIILVVFAASAIYRTLGQFRARKVSKYWFTLWTLVWLAVIVVAITPHTTDLIAQAAGVGRGADLLVYSSIVVLIYAVFRLVASQQRLSQELTTLIRKIAIDQAQTPDESPRT